MTKDLTIGFNYDSTRFEPFVILAVTQPTQDAKEQGVRNAEFALWLIGEGIAYKQLLGCYKGQQEVSFLVRQDAYMRARMDMTEWLAGQESILVLSQQAPHRTGQRDATLHFANGGISHLGKWTNVSKAEALKADAWTYDPAFEEYYVAK